MNWISMEDESPVLPDGVESDEFLVAWIPVVPGQPAPKSHFYEIATWDASEEEWHFTPGIYKEGKVLAWMPLPPRFI